MPDFDKIPAWFLGANSPKGYYSKFDQLFRPFSGGKLFLLKGGPGTGKSTLMKRVAKHFSESECVITRFLCSSDPSSLDGVILSKGERKVALLDGTAPHERGANIPGAVDEFVHLSSCWDTDVLIQSKADIQSERKAADEAYARARNQLAIAGRAQEALDAELDNIIDKEKLRAAVVRELRSARITNCPFEEVRYLSACGGLGPIRLNTFCKESEVVAVTNEHGAAHCY
jgi:hypothetical protein